MILARDLWQSSIKIELRETYRTLVINGKLPDGVLIEKELLVAALSNEDSPDLLLQKSFSVFDSENRIPEKLIFLLFVK